MTKTGAVAEVDHSNASARLLKRALESACIGHADPLDRARPPGRRVEVDDGALEVELAVRGLHALAARLLELAVERDLRLHPDHPVEPPGEPQVADGGGAAGEDALVGRLHVRVRPHHGGDAAVDV